MSSTARKDTTHSKHNHPWLFFQVTVAGLPPLVITAPNPGVARERAFRRLSPLLKIACVDDFHKIAVIKPCQQPVRDGYEGVRRQFKIDVRPGRRVRLQSPGLMSKGEGYVVYPEGAATMVHVVIDGSKTPIRVPPGDVRAL